MKRIKKARLLYPDIRVKILELFQLGETIFRWRGSDQKLDKTDYPDEDAAIIGLRVTVESDPAFKGVDLTILPLEPLPEERAATTIFNRFLSTQPSVEELETIIRQEIAIDQLREHGGTLLAYLLTHGWVRDLALGGLMLNFLDALERSGGVKYDALRKTLTELPMMFTPASQMPGGTIQ